MSPMVETVVARLLSPEREGTAFVNDPSDHGGATHFGLTIPFVSDITGLPCTAQDIEKLTQAEAIQIYETWMMRTNLAALPNLALMDAVTDFACHSGLGAAVEALQRAVGVPADGEIGPITLAAIGKDDPVLVAAAVCADRAKRWARIFEKDPSQRVFAAGWLNRLGDVLEGLSG